MTPARTPGALRRSHAPSPAPRHVPRRTPWRALARAALAAAVVLVANVAAAAEPERVRLETSLGDIVLELDAERAPESVENFLDYVDAGFYDGTIFHRVIEGFMIQGGGFDERFSRQSTRSPIRNEANNGLSNRRYSVAMARTNAPHSATSQFFINTVDNPNLDHTGANPRGWGYAVFARVVDGQDVVERISRVPTGAGGPFSRDAPREPIVILEASRVEPVDDEEGASGAGGEAPEGPASALPEDGETTSAVSDARAADAERVDPL